MLDMLDIVYYSQIKTSGVYAPLVLAPLEG